MTLEFGPGCLKQEELLALQNGDLEIHCLDMRLEQCAKNQPLVYTGPGMIGQGSDGGLEFSLYAKESTPFETLLSPLRDVPSGKIIPDEKFFNLTATDLGQRKWVSSRVLPKMSSSQQGGTICSGDIEELVSREKLRCTFPKDYLFLRLSERVKFPYNAPTKTDMEVADRQLGASTVINVLQFSAVGHKFYLRDDLDTSLAEVISEGLRFSQNIETRIIETLQFLLARPVAWTLMTKYTEEEKVVSIRTPHSEALNPRSQPPIAIQLGEDKAFCVLFDKYLQHVMSYPKDKLHPISAHMRAICRANTGSINAQALTICTAIESLLKDYGRSKPKVHR